MNGMQTLALFLLAVLGASGCERGARSGDVPRRAQEKLTEAQIEMLLEVRRRALESREEDAWSPESLAERVAAEIRAAEELGVSLEEYRTVRERVASARPAEAAEPAEVDTLARIANAVAAASRRIQESAGAEAPESTEESEQQREHDRKLLERFESDFEALQTTAKDRPPSSR